MYLKYLMTSVCILLITSNNVFAQKKNKQDKDLPPLPTECFYLKFNGIANKSTSPAPFSKIIISDNRMDTSKLGYYYNGNWSKIIKLCVRGDFSNQTSSLFNKHFIANFSKTEDVILACVKNLSIRIIHPIEDKILTFKDYSFSAKIEFYLKRDSCFYPLYRFDSTFKFNIKSEKDFSSEINTAMMATLENLLNPEIFNLQKKKCLSSQQIVTYNNAMYDIPVLTDKVAQKGIYLNLTQFKMNQPAYKDFTTNFSTISDVVYVKGKNLEDSSIIDAWGYCDGNNFFVRKGFNFFPLHRSGNIFEFWAFDDIRKQGDRYRTSRTSSANSPMEAAASALVGSMRTLTKEVQLYQLDIVSGEMLAVIPK